MNNLKRLTVCKLAGHKWARVAHPTGPDGGPRNRLSALSSMWQGEPQRKNGSPA
jgi:hypothetical protein